MTGGLRTWTQYILAALVMATGVWGKTAQAQVPSQWTTSCKGCHKNAVGDDAPKIAHDHIGGQAQFGLGDQQPISTYWMFSASNLADRAHLLGPGAFANEMTTLTAGDATAMWDYLVKVRDGEFGAPVGSTAFAGGAPVKVGFTPAPTVSPTIAINNYRPSVLNFTWDFVGSSDIDATATSSCGGTTGAIARAATDASATTCTLTVHASFTPTGSSGPRTKTLRIFVTELNGTTPTVPTQTFAITGTALLDDVNVSISPPAFPPTIVDTAGSVPVIVTIANARLHPITFTRPLVVVPDVGTVDGEIVISNETCVGAPQAQVPALGSCQVKFQFNPKSPVGSGSRSAKVQLNFSGTSGDPSPTSQQVALMGTANPTAGIFTVTADHIPFSAIVGTSALGSVFVKNDGGTSYTLNLHADPHLDFGGTAASDYTFDATNECTPGFVVLPGTQCKLVVKFTPSVSGDRPATLSIPNSLTAAGFVTLQGPTRGQLNAPGSTFVFDPTPLTTATTMQTITLTHGVGGDPIKINQVTVTGSLADFDVGGTCAPGKILQVGDQCTVTAVFHPKGTMLGVRMVSIALTSDAANPLVTINATGTATAAPAPVVLLNPQLVPFGKETIGGLYKTQPVTLTNTGNAPLTSIVVAVTGAGFTDATPASNSTKCPSTLANGASCTIEIAFNPTTVSPSYIGQLSVSSNAAGSPHMSALTGEGLVTEVPMLEWSPAITKIDFTPDPAAATPVGTVTPPQPLILHNGGQSGVKINVINAIGKDSASFSVSAGNCPVGGVLYAGDTCQINVSFAPGSGGTKTATVQVASTGSTPPTVTLSGIGSGGSPPLLVSTPTALVFSTVTVGAQSVPLDLTLRATGSGALNISAMGVSGPFELRNKTCPAMPFLQAANGECVVSIVFKPTAAGAATGTLSVTNDGTQSPVTVTFTANAETATETSSGGCSIGSGESPTDPTLWTLVALAGASLICRRRRASVPVGHNS